MRFEDLEGRLALVTGSTRGIGRATCEALLLLRRGEGRSIVNVSSINYRMGIPRRSICSISKARDPGPDNRTCPGTGQRGYPDQFDQPRLGIHRATGRGLLLKA
jgi:hypothetical protein